MDPFSALSIATGVAQFLGFGCSLVSTTVQIYKSGPGATISHIETTFAARRLREFSERMKSAMRDPERPKLPGPAPIEPRPPKPPIRDDSTPAKTKESDAEKEQFLKEMQEYQEDLETYPLRNAEFERQMAIYHRAKESLEALCEICEKCISLSDELLAKLNELRLQGPKHRKFKSIRLALKSVWSNDAICALEKRLESHRREVSDYLLAATW
jgi:hypothetical protein